ncbi:hypothetical protein SO694_00044026 [Aureococcus anophagefferens]|uniref:U-box domain-containing protein n=1 Tax=Aureococcus anophagefferens TaxID=44056 RepID=A0ABR1G7H8_AURAN
MGQSASSDTSTPPPPAATKPAPRACAKPADPARIAALLIEFLPAPRDDDDDDDGAETEDYASDDDDSLDDIVERVDDRSAKRQKRPATRSRGTAPERKPAECVAALAAASKATRAMIGPGVVAWGVARLEASLGAFETGYADVGGERVHRWPAIELGGASAQRASSARAASPLSSSARATSCRGSGTSRAGARRAPRTDAAEAADALAYELGGLLAAEARGDALNAPWAALWRQLSAAFLCDRDDGEPVHHDCYPWYHLDCPHNVAAAEDLAAGLIATCVAVASATAPRRLGTFEQRAAPRAARFVTWLEQLPTLTEALQAADADPELLRCGAFEALARVACHAATPTVVVAEAGACLVFRRESREDAARTWARAKGWRFLVRAVRRVRRATEAKRWGDAVAPEDDDRLKLFAILSVVAACAAAPPEADADDGGRRRPRRLRPRTAPGAPFAGLLLTALCEHDAPDDDYTFEGDDVPPSFAVSRALFAKEFERARGRKGGFVAARILQRKLTGHNPTVDKEELREREAQAESAEAELLALLDDEEGARARTAAAKKKKKKKKKGRRRIRPRSGAKDANAIVSALAAPVEARFAPARRGRLSGTVLWFNKSHGFAGDRVLYDVTRFKGRDNFELMEDPVIAADGHTYERRAIAAWFERRRTSPITNEALPNLDLVPAHAIRSMIARYRATAS